MSWHMAHEIDTDAIERELEGRGLSVARLCRAAGVAQSTWHRIKNDQRVPRESTRRVIISALERLRAETGAAPAPHVPQQEAA